jgi:hypothetical protein
MSKESLVLPVSNLACGLFARGRTKPYSIMSWANMMPAPLRRTWCCGFTQA